MATAPSQLEYAPELPWIRRPKTKRLLTMLLLGAIVISAFWWGPIVLNRIEIVYLQYRCMNHTAPVDQVVYVDGSNGVIPRYWSDFYQQISGSKSSGTGTIFLHERTNSAGKRLVTLEVMAALVSSLDGRVQHPEGLPPEKILVARVFKPGSMFRMPRGVRVDVASKIAGFGTRNVKIFAGQPDPSDESHFTFVCEIDGETLTFDGWLDHDDRVIVQPREAASSPSTAPAQ